jgi:Transcriptional regulator/sugar kinase
MYILGYDVGGTKISAVVGHENGDIVKKITRRTMKDYGKTGITDQLISMGEELIKKPGLKKYPGLELYLPALLIPKMGLLFHHQILLD